MSARHRSDPKMQSEEVGHQLPQRRYTSRSIDGMALRNEVRPGQDREDANTSPVVAGEILQHRQRLSHERVVATLRLRIRTLEVINRELKEQLEAVYGELAVVQPKLGSLHRTSK